MIKHIMDYINSLIVVAVVGLLLYSTFYMIGKIVGWISGMAS